MPTRSTDRDPLSLSACRYSATGTFCALSFLGCANIFSRPHLRPDLADQEGGKCGPSNVDRFDARVEGRRAASAEGAAEGSVRGPARAPHVAAWRRLERVHHPPVCDLGESTPYDRRVFAAACCTLVIVLMTDPDASMYLSGVSHLASYRWDDHGSELPRQIFSTEDPEHYRFTLVNGALSVLEGALPVDPHDWVSASQIRPSYRERVKKAANVNRKSLKVRRRGTGRNTKYSRSDVQRHWGPTALSVNEK